MNTISQSTFFSRSLRRWAARAALSLSILSVASAAAAQTCPSEAPLYCGSGDFCCPEGFDGCCPNIACGCCGPETNCCDESGCCAVCGSSSTGGGSSGGSTSGGSSGGNSSGGGGDSCSPGSQYVYDACDDGFVCGCADSCSVGSDCESGCCSDGFCALPCVCGGQGYVVYNPSDSLCSGGNDSSGSSGDYDDDYDDDDYEDDSSGGCSMEAAGHQGGAITIPIAAALAGVVSALKRRKRSRASIQSN
jgi:hypothetical protein